MSLLRRATDQQQSDWRPVGEGLWRWIVGVPELKLSEQYGKYQVRFPLTLTQAERQRLETEAGELATGEQQSWRATYTVGLSLGWFKDGQYQTTKLVDFLAFCLGFANAKNFRKWITEGGGPPRPDDLDDQQAELEAIGEWLKWWENLEVYGSIRHEDDKKDPNKKWARWAGPMPVGSLPGQKDDDYQALGRGKLRAIIADSGALREDHSRESRGIAVAAAPAQQFTSDGDELDDLPF